ncbi:chromosomal replication initiator protein [Spiroplasma chinense]|uniref:Chromosomal replication initiator protein DnaA n=1 Tax=Spiroplasma chinense TaxID=216932 RepID=A0A5B9Y3F8_9MOLU|nr:chromosomal replication initiator protein DnaA [Spiroplasma chinense]QEH61199.1 chromosomal replication initiator protein [Spiroplasma chinense]
MTNTVLWKKIKEWLISSDLIEPNIYEDYIKNASLESLSPNNVAIVVSSDLSKYYLENLDSDIDIKSKICELLEKDVMLTFLTKEEYKKEEKYLKVIKKNKIINGGEFSFENFVSGVSNMNAYNASKAIINNLGTKWNPLFIHGDSGLGKTHLLKAILNELSKDSNDINIKYYTSADFRKEILDSLQDGFKEIESTKEKFANLDVILIDDIQFLANSGKTNEIFFNLFNSCVENNKQIVITSDKAPEYLNGFDKRLVSRFNQGLNVKIDTPDIVTATAIVDYKSRVANLLFTEEVKKYIASYYGSDVRKIEGVINKIEFAIIQDKEKVGKTIDLEDINLFLEDYSFAPGGDITIQKIKNVVAQNYGVTAKALDSKVRLQAVVRARHVAMYLTGEILKKNYTEIGVSFGGKDHTTVMHAFKKINESLESDKIFKKTLNKIKKEIVS